MTLSYVQVVCIDRSFVFILPPYVILEHFQNSSLVYLQYFFFVYLFTQIFFFSGCSKKSYYTQHKQLLPLTFYSFEILLQVPEIFFTFFSLLLCIQFGQFIIYAGISEYSGNRHYSLPYVSARHYSPWILPGVSFRPGAHACAYQYSVEDWRGIPQRSLETSLCVAFSFPVPVLQSLAALVPWTLSFISLTKGVHSPPPGFLFCGRRPGSALEALSWDNRRFSCLFPVSYDHCPWLPDVQYLEHISFMYFCFIYFVWFLLLYCGWVQMSP